MNASSISKEFRLHGRIASKVTWGLVSLALVKATLPQHRVTKLSPRPAGEEELTALFEEALQAW